MPERSSKPPRFNLCADHPALDLVNSLDNRFHDEGPRELLADYADLLRFSAQAGVLDARQARRLGQAAAPGEATRALHAARELREALAAVLYGRLAGHPAPAAQVRILERHFHGAGRHRQLRWRRAAASGGRARLEWDRGPYEGDAQLPVWLLAQAAGELMLTEAIELVRSCGAPTCRWLFLDTSRNHTRRWCDMRLCGNRMKARRFQERRDRP